MARGWESSLEADGALVAASPILGSIPTPLGLWVSLGLGVVVITTPFQTKFPFC